MSTSSPNWLERTELILGSHAVARLHAAHLLIVGLGGVGGKACELLARAGVGHFTLIDHDRIDLTNLNRQIIARRDNVGKEKVKEARNLILSINPEAEVHCLATYLEAGEEMDQLLSETPFDYVLDCIDTLTPKCQLLLAAHKAGRRVISAMGAGAKLDVSSVSIVPLGRTKICTLARNVRKRLRQAGAPSSIEEIPCVFSTEPPIEHAIRPMPHSDQHKRSLVGTISYMPQLFGLQMAAYVLRDLCAEVDSAINSSEE